MKSVPDAVSHPSTPSPDAGPLSRRLRLGYFTLEGLNSLGSAYYFNYLFFYLQAHFGFGDRRNLMMAGLYGFIYMFAAYNAGPFAEKRGYFFTLVLGFTGIMLTMITGALIPNFLGYSHQAMIGQVVTMAVWTAALCLTWPTLQVLLSRGKSAEENSRTAGTYNIIWAGAAALAYLTSGVLLEKFGAETLFWVPAGLHLIQLAMLPGLKKLSLRVAALESSVIVKTETVPPLNPRPISKARTFVFLARVANPFAYVGIYGVLPVIPRLSERFGLTPAMAGLVCSVWFWSRLSAFVWFSLWTGWQYRFKWLFGAFICLIASFVAILVSSQIWMLVLAQVIFGLTIGLIYQSSLFYSMDAGESKGKSGGFHEAAIGFGIFIGPGFGVSALYLFPHQPEAGTWGMAALLIIGLLIFLGIRLREVRPEVRL